MDQITHLADLGYLVAAALFILGIKGLGSPRTAVRGNQLGAAGMFLAVLITVVQMQAEAGEGGVQWGLVALGLAAGGAVGLLMAKRVEMTGMPELVALLNGFGGAASSLVGLAELVRLAPEMTAADGGPAAGYALWRAVFLIGVGASSLIGWTTLTGSVVAMLKLSGKWNDKLGLPGGNAAKAVLLAGAVVSADGAAEESPGGSSERSSALRRLIGSLRRKDH